MISSCIESDIVIVSSCRAARPDPHHSRCTVVRASHYPRITDLMKTDRFVMFFPLPHTLFKPQYENIPGMVNSVDSIYMFGKGADTMRMLRSEDLNREIDEKLLVLWCFIHCRTFYSSRSTKTYQELSTRWTVPTCLTRVQIPCGCSEQRTRIEDLMKNWPFCDVFYNAEHLIQVVVQKRTRDCQLNEPSEHVWQGCRYHADVQSNVQDCGGPAEFRPALAGGKNEPSLSRRFHPPWVKYGILTRGVQTVWHNPK